MPKLNSVQKFRARRQLELDGKPIPPELEKMQTGRKRSSESNSSMLEKKRKKYYDEKMQKLGINTTVISTTTMTLRNRKKHANNVLLEKACDMFNTWSTTLRESCDSVKKLRKAMAEVKSEVEKNFEWISTKQQPNLLAFVTNMSSESIYHPWVEVKKSEIIEESKEEKCYGLFAARDFPANTEIGLYTGNVETIREGVQLSEFKLCYREKYLIDIVDQTEKRLEYQTGAHMVNDKDWEEKGSNDETNNNAMISDHLILYSTRDIKKGEEITVPYNLDK